MVEQQSPATRRVVLKALPLPDAISVGALAERMDADPVSVIKQLMRAGVFASINEVVDYETASVVARAFGFSARQAGDQTQRAASAAIAELTEDENAQTRPPVVAVLGHVDHGKTTLLDTVRKTSVAQGEAGGITQHIGAYAIEHDGQSITFIDTPGHEAFTAMRARGAQVTDIAILVVAADDGVMPQTAEAIDHIKAADVPMIVAINKSDLSGADPERVRRMLAEKEVVVEKWGGDVIDVEVSATTGAGVDDLLASIQLLAEMGELKANPRRAAMGVVIESKRDKSRGAVSTVLVQTGTLQIGDNVVVGTAKGRVKALVDDQGRRVQQAGPSVPVEMLGLSELPDAGARLVVVSDDKAAREVVEGRQRAADERRAATLQDMGARAASGEAKELAIVLKTDVFGSVDAVRQALEGVSAPEAQVRIIHAAPGAVTENDVLLAAASDAVIVGFNTRTEPGAKRLAGQDSVEIRNYAIIYRLTEDVEKALQGMLAPVLQDIVEGRLTVRAVFDLSRNRRSAGCYVAEGAVSRGAMARVLRGGAEVFDGPIASLRRFKNDVRQVQTGYECGLTLDGFSDFQEGDVIEAHRQQAAG